MQLNRYAVQILYSGVNWLFLLSLKYFMITDEYSAFMYFFVYAHAISGILNYLFAYSLLKKDYSPINSEENIAILLYMILAGVMISLIYPIWFIVFSVAYTIKETYYRDVIKSARNFSLKSTIFFPVISLFSAGILAHYNVTKDTIFIMLSISNLAFSYPLILKTRMKIKKKLSINWDDIVMPLIGSSKNVIISEILLKALTLKGYGEFYYVRNLLGPLGQITNLINVGISGKSDKTSRVVIRTLEILCVLIFLAVLGYYISTTKLIFAAIVYSMWDNLYGIVSFRIYVDKNLRILLISHFVIITICTIAYLSTQVHLLTTLIFSFLLSTSMLYLYFLRRER